MIYQFSNPATSAAIGIYSIASKEHKIKLVRARGAGITFESIIDKKAGVKVVGLGAVLSYLSGAEEFSHKGDYCGWLCSIFDVRL